MSRRYSWLGTTRKKAVCDITSSCFDAWLRDWCLQHDVAEASIASAPLAASCQPEEYATWAVETTGGYLLTAFDQKLLDAFGSRLALADAEQSDGMAGELARAALPDLLVRLAARAGHHHATPVPWNDAWPDSILRPEWGGLGLRVSFDGFELMVGMDRTVIDAMCPAKIMATGTLSNRAESLGSLPVMLSAVLDFGSVNARDLAGLEVGEVLVSERMIGEPIALRTNHRDLFNASLARSDGQFAIVAAALPTRENP